MLDRILKALNKKKINKIKQYASWREVPESVLKSEKVMTLMSYPEATAITILDSYSELLKKGYSQAAAIVKIETTRSSVNPGLSAYPKEIDKYLIYRIELEHSKDMSLTVMDYTHMLDICNAYIGNK